MIKAPLGAFILLKQFRKIIITLAIGIGQNLLPLFHSGQSFIIRNMQSHRVLYFIKAFASDLCKPHFERLRLRGRMILFSRFCDFEISSVRYACLIQSNARARARV